MSITAPTTRAHRARIALAGLVLSAAWTDAISAQQSAPPAPARQGFWISAGAGGGNLGCDGCGDQRESGTTVQLAIGTALSPRLSVGASANNWSKAIDGTTISMLSLTAMVRFYPSVRNGFHVSGGVGVGRLELQERGSSATEDGSSALVGIGYDFRVRPKMSITPFANAVAGSFNKEGVNFNQVGISITWH
jgi:hypothetical protein